MKKIFIISAALIAFASCGLKEEFQPVFTGKYDQPLPYVYYEDSDFDKIITIADLVGSYTVGTPKLISSQTVIKGRVSTTDQPGNFYKSFYLQDATGGIEIKVGKNALYNDYLEGQTVYVDCEGLTVGMYGNKSGQGYGMVQIGFSDPSGEYETSYLEEPTIIASHLYRGDPSDIVKVEPAVITESQLPASDATQKTNVNVGRLVTLKGLSYGNEVFCMLYIDPNADHKAASNRIFLSDETYNINTWAMSKNKMDWYLREGKWDSSPDVAKLRGDGSYPSIGRSAYSVSQYFKMGSHDIQIRTSGFCKFADLVIPADVINGSKKINVTGILSLYQGSIQFTVNSQRDFTYEDGTPIYPEK